MVEQRSLVDALIDPRLGSNAKLAGIERLVDWSQLEPLVSSPRPGRTGRPPHAAPAMLKALYLQALHDLPDPDLKEPLLDRLSFRRFCGLALDAGTPYRRRCAGSVPQRPRRGYRRAACRDQPAARCARTVSAPGHDPRCIGGQDDAPAPAWRRDRAGRPASRRARRRLDPQGRQTGVRISLPHRHRRRLGPHPHARLHLGQGPGCRAGRCACHGRRGGGPCRPRL